MVQPDKKNKLDASYVIFIGVVIYISVALLVFSVRHPFLTDMEVLQHFGDAMNFEKMNFEDLIKHYNHE